MPNIHPPDMPPPLPAPFPVDFTFQLVIGIEIKLVIVLGGAVFRAETTKLPDTAVLLTVVVKSTSVTFAAIEITEIIVTLTVLTWRLLLMLMDARKASIPLIKFWLLFP